MYRVSTHSRPKAADCFLIHLLSALELFQHTAARRRLNKAYSSSAYAQYVSTHSRPKAAETIKFQEIVRFAVSTHSRPKAAEKQQLCCMPNSKFQHTAARRRLTKIF